MNNFSQKTELEIKSIIDRFLKKVIQRRVYDEPWDYEEESLTRPFHVALVPEAIWKGSKFERSFVTSLGMIGWEQIARVIAEDHHGFAKNSYSVEGKMYKTQMHQVQNVLNQLEHKRKPNHKKELNEVLNEPGKEKINVRVTADLYVKNIAKDKHYYFEIKAPKPNSDQSKVSKEKILKIKAMYPDSNHKAFFALPYNPYESREKYNWAHPKRWFNMKKSPLVLIGKEFWDLLGGKGAFESLINVFEDVGERYRNIITEEYLKL